MKLLCITSLYPPHHVGGYEIRSQDILEGLEKRGHTVKVLVSTYGLQRPQINGNIYRYLHLEPSKNLIQRIIWDISDLWKIKRQISTYKPDIVFLFHVCQLTRTLFPFLTQFNIPIIYDEGGVGLILAHQGHGRWITFCERESEYKWKNITKSLVCRFINIISFGLLPCAWKIPNMLVYFNSGFSYKRTLKAGVILKDPQIIHSAIDLSRFPFFERKQLGHLIRFVIPGRITEKKGIDEAIKAIKILKEKFTNHEFLLKVVGPIQDESFFHSISNLIEEEQLVKHVKFIQHVPHAEMYEIYKNADFCLLLTKFESFSRIPLEAMACGSIMICSNVGGGNEIIINQKNGFLINNNYPESITKILETFLDEPQLLPEMTQNARSYVEKHFSFSNYINKIENLLYSATVITTKDKAH